MASAISLAAVLAWAGAAKLQRLAVTKEGFAALHLPRPDVLAVGVPIAELLIAVVLLAVPPVGAVAALVLLAGFTAVVVREVRGGSEVPCACFGQPHAPPLSWTEVARNGMLAVLGVLGVAAGAAHVPGARGVLVVAGLALLGLGVLSHLRSTHPQQTS
jgi:hypothetical protein